MMMSLGTLVNDFSCETHEIYRDCVLCCVNYIGVRPFCSRDQNTPELIADQNSWSLMLTVFISIYLYPTVAIVQYLALSRFKSKRLEHLVSPLYLTGRGSPRPRVVSLADSLPILVDCRGYIYILFFPLSMMMTITIHSMLMEMRISWHMKNS